MTFKKSKQGWAVDQWAVSAGVCAVWVLALALLMIHFRSHNGWVLGDWMIDYRQGFVRRGLSGALAQFLAGLLPGGALLWATALIAACWTVLALHLVKILTAVKKPVWFLLLLLSPAGLLFSVYGADQVGRKEIVLFAAMAVFVWRQMSSRALGWLEVCGWLVAGVTLSLMHEVGVFYGAYFALAAAWSGRGSIAFRSAFAMVAGMLAGAASILLFSRTFDGPAFCASLIQSDGLSASICNGTITWKLLTVSASHADTLLAINYFSYYFVYGVCILLIAAPVVFWSLNSCRLGEIVSPLKGVALAWLISVPLFLIAVDWGRFIQIHVVLLMLSATLLLPQRFDIAAEKGAGSIVGVRGHWQTLAVLASFATYAFWNMPVCCQSNVGGGLLPKAESALRLLQRFL